MKPFTLALLLAACTDDPSTPTIDLVMPIDAAAVDASAPRDLVQLDEQPADLAAAVDLTRPDLQRPDLLPPPADLVAPTCSDGVQNQDETDVDCGGGTCRVCISGKMCSIKSDCTIGLECIKNICGLPACSNTYCGASKGCPACPDGSPCVVGGDCISKVCFGGTSCATPTCTDGVQNGNETDIDCGGGTCKGCSSNKHCLLNRDCGSGMCNSAISCS